MDDLFIVSYPRSGTTWLRFLLFELLTGQPAEFVSVNARIPYIGRHRSIPHLLPNGGSVIQSHEAYLRGVGAAIYVVRDPRSVVLSEYRWQLRTGLFKKDFDRFFDRFVSGTANPYGRWDEHVQVWVESELVSRRRLHVVRYEDLRADAVQHLQAIMEFIGLPTDRSLIERVVSANDLAQMRAKEERAPSWATGAAARPEIRFVNTGSTTDWKDQLTLDQVTRLEHEFEPTLRLLEYEPLEPSAKIRSGGPATARMARAKQYPSQDGLKVIYIAGWGRSGSTLLDNLLGQVDGFFSTGELRYIWERGVLGDWTCGCGRAVKQCEVWSKVLAKLRTGDGIPNAATIVRWQRSATRLRHTWRLLRMNDHGPDYPSVLQPYLTVIGNLYSAVAQVTGARVVIDSSKRPSDAAILDLVPGVQLFVVHLVRDPRAVAFSWGKRQTGIDRHGVIESTGSWVVWNLASESLRKELSDRSMVLRYEDFVNQPIKALERIVSLVGEDPKGLPDMRDGIFELRENHTVSGNPSRFRLGSVEVRLDNQWVDRLGTSRAATATMLALPLLRRYGYPVRIRREIDGAVERRTRSVAVSASRVVLLTNFIPPYRLPVFEALRNRVGELQVCISTVMESNRSWPQEWGRLDVNVQRTLTLHQLSEHPHGYREHQIVHVPYNTLPLLYRMRPDVVISSEFGLRTAQAALYCAATATPLVIWAGVSEASEMGRGPMRHAMRRVLVPRADALVVNGESGARYLRSLSGKPGRFVVVPYTSGLRNPADRVGAETASYSLLYVGQLIERKGIVPFVEALARWGRRHPEGRKTLRIVGDGPDRERLAALDLPPNVTLRHTAYMPYDRMAEVYRDAELLAFPTLADEWGLVVNEAMAAGLPVLGSIYSQAVEELVEDGVTGWTFAPNGQEEVDRTLDAALRLGGADLARMGAAARDAVRHLTPGFAADRLAEALELARRNRDRR